MNKRLIIALVLLGIVAFVAVINGRGGDINLIFVDVQRAIGILLFTAVGVVVGLLLR